MTSGLGLEESWVWTGAVSGMGTVGDKVMSSSKTQRVKSWPSRPPHPLICVSDALGSPHS